MAEQEPTAEQLAQIAAENEEDEHSVNYKPPAQKSIQEIQELDRDDESLRKYKEALLGRVAVSADPNVPNVIVTRLTLVCSTAPGPLELDLTGEWYLLRSLAAAAQHHLTSSEIVPQGTGALLWATQEVQQRGSWKVRAVEWPRTWVSGTRGCVARGDLESFKKQSFVLKEGVEYRIKISFRVNREIVSGMKYIQHTYRKGVKSE
ncbi:hypothetical protein MC885_005547 [Smutsia gigantea]|nr:hypothetical protein MC885_005547 [Smutsia gigantea]